jgi:fructose-1,6-bisphosphatase/inositol monophosphatase family enzyme
MLKRMKLDSELFGARYLEVAAAVERAVMAAAIYLDGANNGRTKLEVEVKADHTLVMNLDLESQRLILNELRALSYPIVAEEDPASHPLIAVEHSYLLVDPLDGTTSAKRFLGQVGGQVGFGPLVGFVDQGRLSVACFYSVPLRRLFLAVHGQGTFARSFGATLGEPLPWERLKQEPCASLSKAGMLFFISPLGEARVVEHIRRENLVENIYRFGSFASDSARIALGYEQIQMQFMVKPWDFSGVLLAAESGSDVICDPLNRRVPLDSWRIEPNNPILVLPKGTSEEFFRSLDRMP